jgi:nucleotidyltransferase substrate binding protein (TIGR01987 family)
MINLTPMANAVRNLTEALHLVDTMEAQAPEPVRLLLRAGLIQTFEYNYELAIVMMTRYLKSVVPNPSSPDLRVFEELIRVADERDLVLSPFVAWKTFRQARNNTSHTYDETNALAVVQVIPAFEKEVSHLLARLQERTGP